LIQRTRDEYWRERRLPLETGRDRLDTPNRASRVTRPVDVQTVRPADSGFQAGIVDAVAKVARLTVRWAAAGRYDHGIRLAAVVAPSPQAVSLSADLRSPTRVSGSRRRRQRRPVAIDSTARTAPVVSLPPCTYEAYGRPTVASSRRRRAATVIVRRPRARSAETGSTDYTEPTGSPECRGGACRTEPTPGLTTGISARNGLPPRGRVTRSTNSPRTCVRGAAGTLAPTPSFRDWWGPRRCRKERTTPDKRRPGPRLSQIAESLPGVGASVTSVVPPGGAGLLRRRISVNRPLADLVRLAILGCWSRRGQQPCDEVSGGDPDRCLRDEQGSGSVGPALDYDPAADRYTAICRTNSSRSSRAFSRATTISSLTVM